MPPPLPRVARSSRAIAGPRGTTRPDPVTIDLGDCSVTIRWRKASDTTTLQALRRAAKMIQARESPEQAA